MSLMMSSTRSDSFLSKRRAKGKRTPLACLTIISFKIHYILTMQSLGSFA